MFEKIDEELVSNSKRDYRYHLKVNVVGNGAVGKTAIVNRLATNHFSQEYITTIGSQWLDKMVVMPNGENARLMIFDLAGQTRFDFVRKQYYKDTSGIIFVYDISRKTTIADCWNWVEEACEAITEAVPIAVVGNKIDLRLNASTHIDPSRGESYAKAISDDKGIPTLFLETSAKTGHNIYRLFSEFSEIVVLHKELTDLKSNLPNLEGMVDINGWKGTKLILESYDKRTLLEFFSYPELRGLSITKDEIINALPENGDYSTGIDCIRDLVMMKLETQIKEKGQTFELDIEKLALTQASRFIGDIINLRREEIRDLIDRVNAKREIGPWDLWNTYYGRQLIKSIDYPREYTLEDTKKMLKEFSSAGIHFEEIS